MDYASACFDVQGIFLRNKDKHITINIRGTMITSTANRHVKNMIQLTKKAKLRQEQQVFLAEGLRIFEEMPKDRLEQVYVSESFLQKAGHRELLLDTACVTSSCSSLADTRTAPAPMMISCSSPSDVATRT